MRRLSFSKQFESLFSHRFVRYVLIGGSTFAIDISLLFIFRLWLGTNLTIATSVGYWISIVYNFTLNRWWSFSISELKSFHKHAVAYGILLACNYAFTIAFVTIFSHYIYFGIAKTLAVVVQTSWTYPIYKHLIFNPSGRLYVSKKLYNLSTKEGNKHE